MESEIRGLDLEKELTCSICAEILFQPLTLLDCLHTYCGSCLKPWFSSLLASSRNSLTPLSPGANPYTCPSCRAPVRDTKHDAKVATLLDMFMAVNPDKGRTAEEKDIDRKKYTPGENVLLKVEEREKSLRERRADDEDRRLMTEVRDLSLREVGVEDPRARRERRRADGRSRESRAPPSRDASRDGTTSDERERERRRRRAEERLLQPETESSDDRRRRTSADRRRNEEISRTAARQIEHQPSLRSLLSTSDIDAHDMEEEILRQIREEGLLDGIDLENIDVNQEDQISQRIADAFQRRQSELARQDEARRGESSSRRTHHPISAPDSRDTSDTEAIRPSRRTRTHSRSPTSTSNNEQPIRPPQSISASQPTHLEVRTGDEGRRRRRRRTTSRGRSSTNPLPVTEPATRPAARSQTDLNPQSTAGMMCPGTSTAVGSSTEPTVHQVTELSGSESRHPPEQPTPTSSPQLRSSPRMELMLPSTTMEERRLRTPPPEIAVPSTALSAISQSVVDRNLVPLPLPPRGHSRAPSLSDRATAMSSGTRPGSSSSAGSTVGSRKAPVLYAEPSLSCVRCAKPHIEYELHYHCSTCRDGAYDICLSCYRGGKGCLHWLGFGQAAWAKWEQMRLSKKEVERPHMLTPSRYVPPKIAPGGADGRRTLTSDDPLKRLQSGTFCMSCFAWTNECYWRCDVCNEGDWGFCNLCVNQGNSCTHPLLPLTYLPLACDPPFSPTYEHQTPSSASILTGPGVMNIGPFKPLTFSTKCDVCRHSIYPSESRYHCFACTSKMPGTAPGDYDICTACYFKQVASRRISAENGTLGWRRCLKGHRMIIANFDDKRGGQRRVVQFDLVGGRGITEQACPNQEFAGELLRWSWGDGEHISGDDTNVKLVTKDVKKSVPAGAAAAMRLVEVAFPKSGGVGVRCRAEWAWFPIPGADDELLFPKGAEVREVKAVTGDWAHGVYMGKRGLFPSPYVKVLER